MSFGPGSCAACGRMLAHCVCEAATPQEIEKMEALIAKQRGAVPITEYSGKKYLRTIYDAVTGSAFRVDVYAVLEAYRVTCPATAQAIKKLLCAGLRDKGSREQDLRETLEALWRAVELEHRRSADAPTDKSQGLKAVDPKALAEFERQMSERVIPEIIRAVEKRQILAAESRQKELQLPAEENPEPPK